MIDAEAVDPVLICKSDLPCYVVGVVETVVILTGRNAGLIMSLELRFSLLHGDPVGEALSPPLVVLGHAVILGKVISNYLNVCHQMISSRISVTLVSLLDSLR